MSAYFSYRREKTCNLTVLMVEFDSDKRQKPRLCYAKGSYASETNLDIVRTLGSDKVSVFWD